MAPDTQATGGLFGGLKRKFAGESFFQNTWRAPAEGGEITLASSYPGDMVVLPVGKDDFLLASGAYLASEITVSMDATWGGAKGFFGGVGLVLLRISDPGKLLACSYGAIFERMLSKGECYVVDTDHIVGMDASVRFSVEKSGSWGSAILGGEGLVCRLTGPGRVLMQSRSTTAFVGWLSPKLPTSSN